MATSLFGVGLLLQAGPALAQQQPKTIQFHRAAVESNSPAMSIEPAAAAQQPIQPPIMDKTAIPKAYTDEALGLRGVKEVPGLEVITRLEPESALFERMKQEALKGGERIVFPEEPVLSKEPYPGRHWAHKVMQVEPLYVAHGRLLFEQQNFERGLWDLGPLTPVVSVGLFYFDVAALPYHLATRPCQQYDTSAGKCMPGDATPFFLYPPELSFSGAVAEVAVGTALFFIFP
jgi:hypothetical protein